MSNAVNSPIALTGHVVPTKQHRHAEVDSSGPKVRFIPSSEFLAEFVEWRQSRMKILSSKCTFDRWYEALFKEQIWHQWMLNGLVKSMDIPSMEAWIFRSAREAWIFRSARKVSSKDFNGTDATVLGVTAAAVPAIAVSILDLEV